MHVTVVKGVIVAIIPEYSQLMVRDAGAKLYAVVEGHTTGFALDQYTEGDIVSLEIEWLGRTSNLPKVKTISRV